MQMEIDSEGLSGINESVRPIEGNCRAAFTTSKVFSSREDLLSWAKAVGKKIGVVVVITRSRQRGSKIYISLGCTRSGKYIPLKKKTSSSRNTGTRKCGCPFKLRGRPLISGEGWILRVVNGCHNHELAETLVGHPYAGRLKTEEKEILGQMTKNMVKPKSILLTLREGNSENLTTMKQIYNARYSYKKSERGPRTEMQQLMKLMERDKYVYWCRKHETSDVIRDVFWAHPDAINLLNVFNIVLLIDTTYKTNRYRLPLLAIVGVTSTDQTFSVAFAYLEAERSDNFCWALLKLKGLFVKQDIVPQIFVTDRDIALMNAVEAIFPTSKHLLCRYHIQKNVQAKCKLFVHPKEKWEGVMNDWGAVIDSRSASEYVDRLLLFEKACSAFPLFVDYVKNIWLIPHKERFVLAWIDRVMHLGNTTNNRVESAHARLKKMLFDSRGDLCTCWDAMNNMLKLQHIDIKASFQQSINKWDHNHSDHLYCKLRGFVSKTSMVHIGKELNRVKFVGRNSSVCGCVVRITHGIPCACELGRYTSSCSAIPLFTLHLHWRRLNFGDQGHHESGSELSLQVEIDALLKRFADLDLAGKIALKSKIRELAFPETNSMKPPPEKVKTKGAPKDYASKIAFSTKRDPSYFEHVDAIVDNLVGPPSKKVKTKMEISKKRSFEIVDANKSAQDSNSVQPSTNKPFAEDSRPMKKTKVPMLDKLPSEFHSYIHNVINVEADGNCGYRAIALGLGMGEESWSLVRVDLIRELKQHTDDYVALFGCSSRVVELENSLYVDQIASFDKWMTIPDMGYVIASKYNIILVCLSIQGSSTFFPLRGVAPSLSRHRLICIGLVDGCHFVQVLLKPGSPLPTVAYSWERYCQAEARSWQSPYMSRLYAYRSLLRANEPPAYIDITED